jgi:hypothetical protein
MSANRIAQLQTFYSILGDLEAKLGGTRTLAQCSGRLPWPRRGIYFFLEPGENRSDSGSGPRVVRVGTHALTETSSTHLWGRLSQHRGSAGSGGGNHRGSIFRLIVGAALMARNGDQSPTWGHGKSAPAELRAKETGLECEVSKIIGAMPFLWLAVDADTGGGTLRGDIERDIIALLSNYGKEAVDPPSPEWLGHLCNRGRVRASGLWNSHHVDETYDPAFLDRFSDLISDMGHTA